MGESNKNTGCTDDIDVTSILQYQITTQEKTISTLEAIVKLQQDEIDRLKGL